MAELSVSAELSLKIGDNEIKLTYGEAETLFYELFKIYGKGFIKTPNYVPSKYWIPEPIEIKRDSLGNPVID